MPQSFRTISITYPEPDNGRASARLLTAVMDLLDPATTTARKIDGVGEVVVTDRVVTPQGPRKKAEAGHDVTTGDAPVVSGVVGIADTPAIAGTDADAAPAHRRGRAA